MTSIPEEPLSTGADGARPAAAPGSGEAGEPGLGGAVAADAAQVPEQGEAARPVEGVPVEDGPDEDVPVEDVPVGDVPVGDVPVGDVPEDAAPVEAAPVEDVPGEDAPDDVPVLESPDEDVPVEDVPVEGAAVEDAAVEDAADEAKPGDDRPVPGEDDPDDPDVLPAAETADDTEQPAPDEPKPEPEPRTESVATPAGPPSTPHRSPERARSRLLTAMRPKANRGQLLAALLCAGLGFGLVVQVRATQLSDLDQLRQSDLVRLLQQVNSESEKLAGQEAQARTDREDLVGETASGQVAAQQAKKRLEALGVLTGTVAAVGPGIELVIDDPKKQVDAATLLDTLQELRDAGAEAVQIGSVRVVASTAFEDLDGGVRVGRAPVTPPYRYLVIGDPQTLEAAMSIPGGVLDVLEQKGAKGTVTRRDRVEITALHVLPTPQYARPARDGAS